MLVKACTKEEGPSKATPATEKGKGFSGSIPDIDDRTTYLEQGKEDKGKNRNEKKSGCISYTKTHQRGKNMPNLERIGREYGKKEGPTS